MYDTLIDKTFPTQFSQSSSDSSKFNINVHALLIKHLYPVSVL